LLEIVNLKEAVSRAKKFAEEKLVQGENADEFVEVAEADGFKIYVTAGRTIEDVSPSSLHENPRDVFMLVLEGEIEFTFENMEKIATKAGDCFVLPKHLKHCCVFKTMTVAIEGVYEKGL
jgi:quercetin dioxygenase-like cupin family protein